MELKRLTEKEIFLKAYISKYARENEIFPTQRTMQKFIGLKSVCSISLRVENLRKKGHITKDSNGKITSINSGDYPCPHCGK